MQQSLEREIKAIHAWAKKAPGTKKSVDGDHQHVDYTLVVDGVKLAVVITTKISTKDFKTRVITARELAILDNYKRGGIWKFAYVLDIHQDVVNYWELADISGNLQGTEIQLNMNTCKSINL